MSGFAPEYRVQISDDQPIHHRMMVLEKSMAVSPEAERKLLAILTKLAQLAIDPLEGALELTSNNQGSRLFSSI